jgi:hypothetical protein
LNLPIKDSLMIPSALGFLSDILFILQLPGVDPNDPSVKELLASLQGQSEVCSCFLIVSLCQTFAMHMF